MNHSSSIQPHKVNPSVQLYNQLLYIMETEQSVRQLTVKVAMTTTSMLIYAG